MMLMLMYFCLLQAYTASFFAIPAFRWFVLQRRNAEIEQRNRDRLGWAGALERAGADLRQKVKKKIHTKNLLLSLLFSGFYM